jgi:ElaB/YqjD/DUF883 family membrane-anchored ribosome-binding protein
MSEQGATAQAKDKAQEVAGQAQEKAQQAAGQARSQLRGQIDDRSTKAGQQVSGHASDLRSVGDSLREQGKDQPAKLADQAADRLERAGSWLTNSDGDRIIHDVEDFARRNPWAVMAGGLAIGFAASRMLKASSTERYQSSRYTPPSLPATTGGYGAGTGGERFTRPASATTPATTPPPVQPTTPTTPAAGPGGI